MKRLSLLLMVVTLSLAAFSQETEKDEKKTYTFTDEISLDCTPVRNQFRSGTCWCFSAVSMLESELLRNGKGEFDLSEMFIVRYVYLAKAERYVRLHGSCNFGAGGSGYDVLNVIKRYGIVPEEVYSGLNYGEEKHNHQDLDKALKAVLDAFVKDSRKVSPAWKQAFCAVLDSFLGKIPEKFTFKNQEYTPESFAEMLNLNMDDYVAITSFAHHPFYEKFMLEIPDNWTNEMFYNIPLEEMLYVAEEGVKSGYTITWDGDVSDKGFAWRKGFAVQPDEEHQDLSGTDRDKWESLSQSEKRDKIYQFEETVKEREITQENRQKNFDNLTFTDDHLILLMGLAKNQNDETFLKMKNSWDVDNPYDGYFYMSEPYFKAMTVSIILHKNAIPKDIRKKLNIQ